MRIRLLPIVLFLVPMLMSTTMGAGSAKRIVSLAPSITQDLYLLGLESNVVGITTFCPKGTTRKEIVGTILEPNLEKILSLKPDLVVFSKEGNVKNTYERLRNFKINCFVLENDNDFTGICRNFLSLAKEFDRTSKAKEIIAKAQKKVDAIQKQTRGLPKPNIFWEIGTKPLFTVGSGSFIDDYDRYCNCVNIFGDLKSRFLRINREEVVQRNPDIIFIVEMADITDQEERIWEGFKGIKAVINKKVYFLDTKIFIPNPINFAEGAEKIAQLAHPKSYHE